MDRIRNYPIRVSNQVAVCGFGYIADFKLQLERSSKPFWKYIEEIKLWLLKNKFTDWNVFYDNVHYGQIFIYQRSLIQNANNVIYNMRAYGDSFAMDLVPKNFYPQAKIIQTSLQKKYYYLYFLNKIPTMSIFTYYNYKHKTPYQKQACSAKNN